MPQGGSYVQVSGLGSYIRNIIPDDMGIPSWRSWPYRSGPTGRPGISVTMWYGGIVAERGGKDARKNDDDFIAVVVVIILAIVLQQVL